jgi:hypothetical protein
MPTMTLPARLIEGTRRSGWSGLQPSKTAIANWPSAGSRRRLWSSVVAIPECPEVIFDARPGELFVVRNVANLVPPYEPDGSYHGVSAALEFAVGALKVKHIVVLAMAGAAGCAPLLKVTRRSRPATSSANGCR